MAKAKGVWAMAPIVTSKTPRPRISLINLATFGKMHVIVASYVLHVNMHIRLESLGVFGAAPARHHKEALAWVLIRTLTFSEDLLRAARHSGISVIYS
jgi:hypothetical protein